MEKLNKLLNDANKNKSEITKYMYENNIIPKDIFKKIESTFDYIQEYNDKILSENGLLTPADINLYIVKMINDKVYFSRIVPSTNYLKWKLDTIKSELNLKETVKYLNDDENISKTNIKDMLNMKMDVYNSYYNLLKDIISRIDEVKRTLDTTISSMQSILKNTSFEYNNANKINR